MDIIKLKKICTYNEGYVNPKIDEGENFSTNISDGFPWIKVSELIHGSYIEKTKFYISKKIKDKIKNNNQIFKKNSIVWSKSGSVGITSILKFDTTANRGIINIIPNKKVINKYLFYVLCKKREYFNNMAVGAVLKHFYGPRLMEEEIELPKINIQQSIIDIIEPFEKVRNLFENINVKLNEFVKEIKKTKTIIKIYEISDVIKLKKRGIKQVSAKVLSKSNFIIHNLEEEETYKTNSFFAPEGTMLFCSIRTYQQKFGLTPCDVDFNGTLFAFAIKSDFTSFASNFLNHDIWSRFASLSKGTKMPVISEKDFFNTEIYKVVEEIENLKELYIIINKILLISHKIINLLINVLV